MRENLTVVGFALLLVLYLFGLAYALSTAGDDPHPPQRCQSSPACLCRSDWEPCWDQQVGQPPRYDGGT